MSDPFDGIPVLKHSYRRRAVHLVEPHVSFKTALPPEQWPLVQLFLRRLHQYDKLARRAGLPLSVGPFMREFRKGDSGLW